MPTLQEQIGLARDREALPDDGGLRQKMAIAHATEKERKKAAEQAAKATQAAPQAKAEPETPPPTPRRTYETEDIGLSVKLNPAEDGSERTGRVIGPGRAFGYSHSVEEGGYVYQVNLEVTPEPQAARVPTLSDVPQRAPTASEREFFKSRPEVSGMATDDDAVILNPFSTLKPEQKEAVLLNERARVHMRRSGHRPTFALTPEQRAQFKDYSEDEQDIRETVAARILSGDPSAGNVTKEQQDWVQANLQAAPQEAPAAAPELPGVAAQLGRVPGALAKRVAGGALETGQMLEKGLARTAADVPAMLVESPTARAARQAAIGPNLLEQAGILSPESATWIREKAIPVVADVVAGVVSTVSPKTPGFFLGEASKMLRAVGKTQEADVFDRVQGEAVEAVRAKASALTEGYTKYLLGGGVLDWSIEQTKPYLSETPAESVREVFTNPELLAERVGSMIPYMAGTVALAIATKGIAAPFAMAYLVEGEGAAQEAAKDGATPAEQADIRQLVGFVVGATEMWQMSKILEFVGGRAAQRAFAKKVSAVALKKLAASEAAKSAWAKGASVGTAGVRLAAFEGGQEVLQQATQEIATSGITGEPLDPGFWERLVLAGGVAAVASVLTGGLFSAGQKALGAKVAEAPPAAPAVTEGRGLPPTPDVLEPAPAEVEGKKEIIREKPIAPSVVEGQRLGQEIPLEEGRKVVGGLEQPTETGLNIAGPVPRILYRGVSKETGKKSYRQGKGLYTTTNKSLAAEYGKVVQFPVDVLPRNPLILASEDAWDGWLVDQYVNKLGMRSIREFNKVYPDPGEYVQGLGFDGVQIGSGSDAIFVTYKAPITVAEGEIARPPVGAEPEVAPEAMPGALPEAVEAEPTPVREPLAPTGTEQAVAALPETLPVSAEPTPPRVEPVPEIAPEEVPDIPPKTSQGLEFLPDERGEVLIPPEPKEPDLSQRVRAQLSPEAQKVQSVFDAQQEITSKHRKGWASSLLRKGRRKLLDVSGTVLARLVKTGNPDARRAARRHDLVLGANGAAANRTEEASQAIFTGLAPAEESVLAFHLQAVRTIEASKVVAARGKELKHPGGMTPAQAQQWLNDARKTEGYEKIEKAAAAWNQMILEELDRNHEAGLIGDEAYEFLRENHRYYYPRRFIQHMDPETTQRFGTRRITVPDSGIKALDEGSEQLLVNDPRLFLAEILARGENRRKKNRANQSLAAFARAQPDNGIVREAKIVRMTKEGRPVFESKPKGQEAVRFLEGGRERALFMPLELAEEWVTYSPEISSGAASVLRWVSLSPILKAVATGYNPGFALTNVPRDVGLVWFASDWLSKEADVKLYSPHLPVYLMQMGVDMASVAADVVTNGPKTQQAAREGLFMEFLTHQGQVGRHPVAVRAGRFSEDLSAVGKVLGWAGEKSEILTRMAFRERAMKNGADSETATWIARAYLDFAKGGGYTKFVDSALPYLSAATQGFRSGAKAAAANPAHFAYKVFQLGGASSGLALASLLLFREVWKRIPDDTKNRYFIIPLPSWMGGTYTDEKGQTRYRYLTVSKPEIIRPFAAIFEATTEGLVTGDVPWQRMYGGLKDMAEFVPLGKLPPSLSAYFALVGNYDVWRQQEVWRGPSVDPEAEYTAYTHPLWRWFGETTGLSPERTASAVGDIIPPYNPYILAAMHATELAMKGAPEESKDSFYLKLATDVTGISRVLRSTPAYIRDEELEQIRVSENTRRHKQNVDLAERVAKGEPYQTIERDFIRKQPRQDWKRLRSRATTSIKLRGIDAWWLNLREMPPLPRAQAFHVRFRAAAEEERKALVSRARTVPGVGSETFWSAFRRFRAEVEKIQTPPKPPAKP